MDTEKKSPPGFHGHRPEAIDTKNPPVPLPPGKETVHKPDHFHRVRPEGIDVLNPPQAKADEKSES